MKKGFTLIELLAVIVILALILVIVVPRVSSSLKKARMSTIESSVKLVISQVQFKKATNREYDVSVINADNMYEELGIKNEIFSEVVATIANEGTESEVISVTVIGKGKYSGYGANGTRNEVSVYSLDATAPTLSEIVVDLSTSVITDSVIVGDTINVEWEGSNDAESYDLEVKYDTNEYVELAYDLDEPSYEYTAPNNGASTLQLRVKAENAVGESDWAYTEEIELKGWTMTTVVASGTSYNDIYYYNGRWIAVGDSGYIATSTNGTTWSSQKNGTDKLTFIYNFNGIWVTGGQNGKILISTNGTSWTSKTISGTHTYMAIKEYNGKAVIIGTAGKGATSTDGTNWYSVTDSTTPAFQDIEYFNGKWIAVGQNGKISTSTNGSTWVAATVGTVTYFDIYAVNNKVFAVGGAGTVLVSSDGTTWDSQVLGTKNLTSIYYANSMYVICGIGGEVYSSSDGTNWTKRTTNTTASLRAVYNYNNLWMVVGSGSNVLISNDAINWKLYNLDPSASLNVVNYFNNMWYFAGSGVIGTFAG